MYMYLLSNQIPAKSRGAHLCAVLEHWWNSSP